MFAKWILISLLVGEIMVLCAQQPKNIVRWDGINSSNNPNGNGGNAHMLDVDC